MAAKILSKLQAAAVADALCALTNIGAKIHDEIRIGGDVSVTFYRGEGIGVSVNGLTKEDFASRSEFMAAYCVKPAGKTGRSNGKRL